MMALDLSALEEHDTWTSRKDGRPLELRLVDIEEDPQQPRRTFEPESLKELTESIQLHGVKTPISVRPHPKLPNKWMLNYGARRYRASHHAGKTTIPAFIDHHHTDYHQVIENRQRENLTPMELAIFMQKKIGEGASRAEVARSLSIHPASVTQHLALLDLPPCVEQVYTRGLCTSPKTLYELRSLHGRFPVEVERWCERMTDISRSSVEALSVTLQGGPGKAKRRRDVKSVDTAVVLAGKRHPVAPISGEQSHGQEEGTRGTDRPASRLPCTIVVTVVGRRAAVLSCHENTEPQVLRVQFENGEHADVPAHACLLAHLRYYSSSGGE